MIDRTGALVQIIDVEKEAELQDVYNIEVDEHHTYHVGEIGVWVHNAKCCDVDPAFSQGYDFKNGIDVDLRGTGTSLNQAINEAFRRPGVPKEHFEVTKWGRDAYGKSFPVEYRGKKALNIKARKLMWT